MALLCSNSNGVVISHLKCINDMLHTSHHFDSKKTCYQFKPDLFNIRTHYMMDSQFEQVKLQTEGSASDFQPNDISGRRKKKNKKRKFEELSLGEQEALQFHQQVRNVLQTALLQLVVLARQHNHLHPLTQAVGDNNLAARRAAEILGPGLDLIHTSTAACKASVEPPEFFNKLIEHNGDYVHVIRVLGGDYIIPPHCSFLMSDVSCISSLTRDCSPFDLIVIDPPWYNKSVKRKHKYRMLYDEDLLELPVPILGKHGCLVIVWATNNQQQHRFIQQQLFPAWRVKFLAQWFWLKVTQHGETVLDLDNNHKKPYETLFLGYLSTDDDHTTPPGRVTTPGHVTTPDHVTTGQGTAGHVSTQTTSHGTIVGHVTTPDHVISSHGKTAGRGTAGHVITPVNTKTVDHLTPPDVTNHNLPSTPPHVTSNSDLIIPERLENIEEGYVIISVPSSIHSQKPPLGELLQPFLPSEPRCLEMFARSLQSGWVCWGNEEDNQNK